MRRLRGFSTRTYTFALILSTLSSYYIFKPVLDGIVEIAEKKKRDNAGVVTDGEEKSRQ